MQDDSCTKKDINLISSDELRLLLDTIFETYGYDFREYSDSHISRRFRNIMVRRRIDSVAGLKSMIQTDQDLFQTVLLELSVNVTEMFRDPLFFAAVREEVVPLLQTYPYIKVWHAGCSTGEEVYSMAILLLEEGLLERSIIYATDFNQSVLGKASQAIYPIDRIKQYSINYNLSGSKATLSDYFTVDSQYAKLSEELKRQVVFSDHNLVTDGVFGEMNIIICRNVLIYFNRDLQKRVFRLFYDSLVNGGILGLGSKESLLFSGLKKEFTHIRENIFRKNLPV